jgi:predicted peroxiredoxin
MNTPVQKLLYVQTSGTETPERLYAPFILATTAVAMGLEATIYFLIKGITVVKKGAAEQIQLGTFPTLRAVMDQAVAAGVKLEVCEQSCMLLGLERGDFADPAKVVGAATLNDRLLEADAVLSF